MSLPNIFDNDVKRCIIERRAAKVDTTSSTNSGDQLTSARSPEQSVKHDSKPALFRYLPSVEWLAGYQAGWLPSDLIAGVTLAAYAIPVSLAYAGLAGLPPQVGVYGYLLGGLGYALLGSSRQLALSLIHISEPTRP